MKKNNIFSLKETILSVIFLVTMVALIYFSMWGAHVLGLLNN
jgi:hypothetical protein